MSSLEWAEEAVQFLSEASAVLVDSLDDEAALHSIARLVVPRLADWCAVDVVDPDGSVRRLGTAGPDLLKPRCVSELGRRFPAGTDERGPLDRLVQDVLETGQAWIYPQVSDAIRQTTARNANHLELLQALGLASAMFVPLLARGSALGVIALMTLDSKRRYGPFELAIAKDLASRAALTVASARLHRALAERDRRIEELVGRLLAVQEDERRRIACDVHDGLAQTAASAHRHLQAFAHRYRPRSALAREELARALALAQATVSEARRVIADLRPLALQDLDLSSAIRRQLEELRAQGWPVTYEERLGAGRLPAAVETALFRVAQEALTNVKKHAGTTPVRVALGRDGSIVRLEVRDWGRGFDALAWKRHPGAAEQVGLLGMGERVSLIGGRFAVESQPGHGTRVLVEAPLAGVDPGDASIHPCLET